MRTAKKIWDNLERYLMVALMIVFLVNIFLQVFSRIFYRPLTYTEEISRYSFLWMVLLGFSFSTRYNRHIRVTVLSSRFPAWMKKAVDVFINLLGLAVFAFIFYIGIQYVAYTAPTRTAALNISRAYVALIVPITGLLMVARSAERIVMALRAPATDGEDGK